MTEIEILEHAKSYIDKLANGIDPMTDMPVGEGDAVNNVRVSRCLFYVSDVLGKVIASGGIPAAPKPKKRPFFLTAEQLSRYPYADRAATVSEIADNLNALADAEQCLKMPYTHITGWLIGIGALELCTVEGKSVKRPTARGGELGIATEPRSSSSRTTSKPSGLPPMRKKSSARTPRKARGSPGRQSRTRALPSCIARTCPSSTSPSSWSARPAVSGRG